jgi:homocysteine S-methyltransferase
MPPLYRSSPPQITSKDIYLTDAGIETDLIFNKGIEIRGFAAHTLLPDKAGREAVANYLRDFLNLAKEHKTGFILDSQTWKAHLHWAKDLGATEADLKAANRESVEFISNLRAEFADNDKPIVLNGILGPRGDAYVPEDAITIKEAQEYHATQIQWLADTEVDMITGMTLNQSSEAIGMTLAAQKKQLPIVISFTVETDGCLPSGQALREAIQEVDAATNTGPLYYMVNCAHPDHFSDKLLGNDGDDAWMRRIRGLRCNASRMSHAELDSCETLDDGNPLELACQYSEIRHTMPWLNVFGGCCGSDVRHVQQIADAIIKQ